jgi:prolipoprotein diacylglyceryltransferase
VGDDSKNDQQQGQFVTRTAFRSAIRAIGLFVIVFVMLLVATFGLIWENTADLGASLAAFTGEQGISHILTLVLIAIGIVVVIVLGISRPRSPRRQRE